MRVMLAGTAQPHDFAAGQAMLKRVDAMLPGQDDARRPSPLRQGGGDGGQFDCFRTGSDDEVDTLAAQPSP